MTADRNRVLLCVSAAVVVAVSGLAACTSRSLTGTNAATPLTVSGVGAMPGSTFAEPSASAVVTVSLPHANAGSIGERVTGNRVIIIGDSVMTSISRRYGNQACTALVPLGWQVEVDAETGRFIPFGLKVLDKRLSAGWDAAVILLGNNYLNDKTSFQKQLHMMLTRLSPRPTVLLTTSMFRSKQAEVNKAIIAEAGLFPNVSVVDWAIITEDTSLTGADGLHLTDRGRVFLAGGIGTALGHVAGTGKCLKTNFSDDSMGSPTGTNGSTGTVAKPSSSDTTTTTKPTSGATTTTVPISSTTIAPKVSPPPVTSTTTPTTTGSKPTTPPPPTATTPPTAVPTPVG